MPVFWLGMQSGTIDKTTMHTSTYAISRPPHPSAAVTLLERGRT